MKKNIFLSFVVLSLLTSCASSPDKPELAADSAGGSSSPALAPAPARPEAPAVTSPSSQSRVRETRSPEVNPRAELSRAVRSGNDEAIQSAARNLLAQNPNDVQALNALAVVYQRRGQLKAAELLLDRAIKAEPNRAELYNNLGLLQLQMNQEEKAIPLFRRSLQLGSGDGSAAANLGSLYLKNLDYARAQAALEIAAKSFPRDVKVQLNYSIALLGLRRFSDAEKTLESALQVSPQNTNLLFQLAKVYIENTEKPQRGLELINRIKVLGVPSEFRNAISQLENSAQTKIK